MSYNYDSLNSTNKYTSDQSYEEDSLIENIDPKPDSKENIRDLKKSKDKKNKNVITTIDPTFSKRSDSPNNSGSSDQDQTSSANANSMKGKKNGYSSLGDNDTEVFLPIQGQKRGTIKSIKKKRSPTQCLQQ